MHNLWIFIDHFQGLGKAWIFHKAIWSYDRSHAPGQHQVPSQQRIAAAFIPHANWWVPRWQTGTHTSYMITKFIKKHRHTHVYITGRVFINILNSSEVKAIKLGCEHGTPRGWMMLRYGLRNGFLESNKHIYIYICTYCVLYIYTYMLVLFNRSVVWESRSTSGCFATRWCLAVMFVGLYTH